MGNSHHNTTEESGDQLDMFEKKAGRQEDIIMSLFKRTGKMTASDCFRMFPDRGVPITSIRRGMTNLSRDGKLLKLEEKKKGIYGRSEYFYQLVIN